VTGTCPEPYLKPGLELESWNRTGWAQYHVHHRW
jgi:hypothetical protein